MAHGIDIFVTKDHGEPPMIVNALNNHGEGLEYFMYDSKNNTDYTDNDLSHLREMVTMKLDQHPAAAEAVMRYLSGKLRVKTSPGITPGNYGIYAFLPLPLSVLFKLIIYRDTTPRSRRSGEKHLSVTDVPGL